MSRYAVKQTRGNKAQRIGAGITNAKIKYHLFGGNTYYEKYERWDKLEARICRIPRIFTIEVIELTNEYIRFIAICSDEFYLEANKKEYVWKIK